MYDLSKFKINTILNNNSNRKTVCVLGHFTTLDASEDANDAKRQAIVILEKKAFTEQDLNQNRKTVDEIESTDENRGYFSGRTKLKTEFVNDIYGNFECYPCPDINSK